MAVALLPYSPQHYNSLPPVLEAGRNAEPSGAIAALWSIALWDAVGVVGPQCLRDPAISEPDAVVDTDGRDSSPENITWARLPSSTVPVVHADFSATTTVMGKALSALTATYTPPSTSPSWPAPSSLEEKGCATRVRIRSDPHKRLFMFKCIIDFRTFLAQGRRGAIPKRRWPTAAGTDGTCSPLWRAEYPLALELTEVFSLGRVHVDAPVLRQPAMDFDEIEHPNDLTPDWDGAEDIPESWRQMVDRCMADDPNERLDVMEVLRVWEKAWEDQLDLPRIPHSGSSLNALSSQSNSSNAGW
ncbi:uncharacterized protein B0T15DRAFT_504566 [Chaetomium strumarium]|uniref:Protein kinase domain-containing protein n=1 Tax=Chaetomium strumarium TaxID=1170767 RepID=A0AAJ0GNQ1_9PEZI|nr:hypothetical protein B0T15DRAFT_504566 [Chaetomium strumarium]